MPEEDTALLAAGQGQTYQAAGKRRGSIFAQSMQRDGTGQSRGWFRKDAGKAPVGPKVSDSVRRLRDIRCMRWVYHMHSPGSERLQARMYRVFMLVVILGNVILFVLASIKQLGENFATFCDYSDSVTSCVFLVDYCCRIATCPMLHAYRGEESLCKSRLCYIITMPAIIDALATFPFFIDLLTPGTDFISFAWVRIFRLFLLFRTSRLATAVNTCVRVLSVNRQILTVSVVLVFFMLLLTSSMLWAVSTDEERSRNGMNDVPSSMFLALLMLTGQGTPDPPMSLQLQTVVAITAVLSVPFFAVPAAMLTWGFEGEAQRLAVAAQERYDRDKVYREYGAEKKMGEILDSSSDDDSSDLEEYLTGVAGGGSDNADQLQRALDFFMADKYSQSPAQLLPDARALAKQMEQEARREGHLARLQQDALALLKDAGEDTGEPDLMDDQGESLALAAKLDKFRRSVQDILAKMERQKEGAGAAGGQPALAAELTAGGDAGAVQKQLADVATAVRRLTEEVGALRKEVAALKS
eukprot:TRINITY_DN66242_c0_g1_i1.p1 TRINITY_DN66242_c0_g1~~TRINITY_DN66242_c0_g1_i1.p1  ORF type:complete len:526 (+),score=165.43 TRINITY_DN66242_c0_g1_i1:95-1672(+)